MRHFHEMIDHITDAYKSSVRGTKELFRELPKYRNELHDKLDDWIDWMEDASSVPVSAVDAALDAANEDMHDKLDDAFDFLD